VAGPIAGWFTAFALFAMLIGNHESRVEDFWLIGLGLLLVVMLIGSHLNNRKARRR
jgi:biotin transporter BioY